jgi:hypothetical protein
MSGVAYAAAMIGRRLFCLAALPAVFACREPNVGVRYQFPSERAFLLTNILETSVFPADGAGSKSPEQICQTLSTPGALAPDVIAVAKQLDDICSFRNGTATSLAVAVGRYVFFARGVGFENETTASGCVLADVFGDEEKLTDADLEFAKDLDVVALVDVPMASAPSFPEQIVPLCQNAEDKCVANTPCR